MNLLNEEVRTLPPLISGGISALEPAGCAPLQKFITGLPSDPVKTMRTGQQYGRFAEFPKSPSKDQADERNEKRKLAVRRLVNSHFNDPKKTVPMNDEVMMKLIFQDTNITSLIQSGVISKGVDLGPALMQTPALLARHVDPNSTRRSRLIADAKLSRQGIGEPSARGIMSNGISFDSAVLRLDPGTSLKGDDHVIGSTQKKLVYNRGILSKSGKQLTSTGKVKVGVVNMDQMLPPDSLDKKGQTKVKEFKHQQPTMKTRGALNIQKSNVSFDFRRHESEVKPLDDSIGTYSLGLSSEQGSVTGFELDRPHELTLFDTLKREVQYLPQYKQFHREFGDQSDGDSEVEALNFSMSVIRSYLSLLAQYSQEHFLIYLGRTLRETADFRAFQRMHNSNWAVVESSFGRLEQVLRRYGAPLAIVDGARLAEVSNSGIASVALHDLLDCLENLDQVGPMLSAPGKLPPLGETRRAVRSGAAVLIQAIARAYLARQDFDVKLLKGRAAVVIQKEVRLRQAMIRVDDLIWEKRKQDDELDVTLRKRLALQWSAAGGEPVGRVEVHLPSVSIAEHIRELLQHLPTCQTHESFLWLSALRDKNVAHLVLVSPIEVPQEVLLHWGKLVGMMNGDSGEASMNRFTVVVPEASAHFSNHLPLAAVLHYSPLATNRIKRIVSRHASRYGDDLQAYIVPHKVGVEEEILSRKLSLPLLSPSCEVFNRIGNRAASKVCFSKAGCHVPIGAHDIKDQADLVVALAKLIASNIDIEEWTLRANTDHDMVGVAMLRTTDFPAVHELRQEKHDLIEQNGGNKRAWMKPDIQLVARSRLLSDLREKLPKCIILARPRMFPDGWMSYLKHFFRCQGVIEAVPPIKCFVGRVTANVLLAPDACKHGDGSDDLPERARRALDEDTVRIESTQELLTSQLGEAVAVVYPQRCVPDDALSSAAQSVGKYLMSCGCLGRVSISFAVFRDAKSGKLLMWGEEISLFPTAHAAFHHCIAGMASMPARPLPPMDPLGELGPEPITTYPRIGANARRTSSTSNSFVQEQALKYLNGRDSLNSYFDDSSDSIESRGNLNQNYEHFLNDKVNSSQLYPLQDSDISPLQSARQLRLGVSKSGSFSEYSALEAAITMAASSSGLTPKGLSYVACCPLYHPGLPTVLPLSKLMRLARLKNHGFDVRAAKGDLFIPVDSLAGGVVAAASVTSQGDEASAAHMFKDLLEFFASRVGRRTVIGQHEAKLHNQGDDGFDRFVVIQEVIEKAVCRFRERRQKSKE